MAIGRCWRAAKRCWSSIETYRNHGLLERHEVTSVNQLWPRTGSTGWEEMPSPRKTVGADVLLFVRSCFVVWFLAGYFANSDVECDRVMTCNDYVRQFLYFITKGLIVSILARILVKLCTRGPHPIFLRFYVCLFSSSFCGDVYKGPIHASPSNPKGAWPDVCWSFLGTGASDALFGIMTHHEIPCHECFDLPWVWISPQHHFNITSKNMWKYPKIPLYSNDNGNSEVFKHESMLHNAIGTSMFLWFFELSLNFNHQPAIGAKVWPCCAALALHLAEHPELVQKRRVFEPLGLENGKVHGKVVLEICMGSFLGDVWLRNCNHARVYNFDDVSCGVSIWRWPIDVFSSTRTPKLSCWWLQVGGRSGSGRYRRSLGRSTWRAAFGTSALMSAVLGWGREPGTGGITVES